MNSQYFDPTMALAGGLLTSAVGEYAGINSPVLTLLVASLGGTVVSKLKHFYTTNKNVLPPVMKIQQMIDGTNTHRVKIFFYCYQKMRECCFQ